MSKSLPGRDLAPACAASCGATTARERWSELEQSFGMTALNRGLVGEDWKDGGRLPQWMTLRCLATRLAGTCMEKRDVR
jgi:hypothetical protein